MLACGWNQSGQLGNGTTQSSGNLTSVDGLLDVVAIGARGNHSLFLLSDGTAWACGSNGDGQLGDGTNVGRTTPVQVQGLNNVVALAAGGNHSIFLRNDGTLWATGWNWAGQLGDGNTASSTTVVQVNTPCIICYDTYAYLSVTACNSYTTPSGNATYTTSGIYEDIIPNALGCDSITVIDLQILEVDLSLTTEEGSITVGQTDASYQWIDCGAGNIPIEEAFDQAYSPATSGSYAVEVSVDGCTTTSACALFCPPTSGAMTVTACDSYSAPSGSAIYTASGTYLDTVLTALGCDSVLTIDLTILNSSTGVDAHAACDSFTWIDGNTYTASNNTATVTLTNAAGCDSLVTLDLTINYSSATTDIQSACESFTWIDGITYTASNNTATRLLTTAAGCDSLVTLDLTISYPVTTTDTRTACDSFTWIDGNTYTASNSTATQLLTTTAGCDSLVTLDLTILNSTSGADVQVACDTFTWIDGNTYTASNNTATTVLVNAAGCDSLVTLDLTILNSTSGTDVQVACDAFTWIDGNTYSASNNAATAVLTNAAGCDSLVTLNLMILNSTSSTDVQAACEPFTWIDGNTYTASNNTATVLLTNSAGCDSIVTLDLTLTLLDATLTLDGNMLTVATPDAQYTWFDCNDPQTPIDAAIEQSFTPLVNGLYAVELFANGCFATSECFAVMTTNAGDLDQQGLIQVTPNPTDGLLTVTLPGTAQRLTATILDASGRRIMSSTVVNASNLGLEVPGAAGLYFLDLHVGDVCRMFRVVKE